MLVHTVYFWLKDSTDRAFFQREISCLMAIPDASRVWIGTPAATAKRPVLDDSWDFSLVVVVADVAGHDAYQAHPLHQTFIGNCKELWDRVLVTDVETIDQAKDLP